MKVTTLFAAVALFVAPAFAGDAPDEFVRFEGMKDQFVISHPAGWHVYDQNVAMRQPPGPFGLVQFSLIDMVKLNGMLGTADEAEATKAIVAMSRGETPGFAVERSVASKGMACAGFSEKQVKKMVKDYVAQSKAGNSEVVVAAPEVSTVNVGGCQGIRVKLRASRPDGATTGVLIYSVSDGQTFFDLFIRSQGEFFEKNLAIFESAVASFKLTGAR